MKGMLTEQAIYAYFYQGFKSVKMTKVRKLKVVILTNS